MTVEARIGIVVGSIAFVILIGVILFLLKKRKKQNKKNSPGQK